MIGEAIEKAERACGYSDAFRGDHIFNVVVAAMQVCIGKTDKEIAAMVKGVKKARESEKKHRNG